MFTVPGCFSIEIHSVGMTFKLDGLGLKRASSQPVLATFAVTREDSKYTKA